MTSGSFSYVANKLIDSYISFAKKAKQLGLKISPKSAIVTSDAKLSRYVVQELAKLGYCNKNETESRDLGVSFTAGKKVSRKVIKTRLKKSAKRAGQLFNLLKE